MSLWDDLVAARAEVDRLTKALATAQATVADLEARAMKGGPDVSAAQGDVDWAKVRAAGYDICFPKVADGDIIDTTFSSGRIASIKAAGLMYAPYYFGRVAAPSNNERNGRLEAAMAIYFASKQGWGHAGDLPLAYDFENESLNGQTTTKCAKHLMEFVRAYRGCMGHYPILYTNPGTIIPIVAMLSDDDKNALDNCPLWISHWNVTVPTIPAPWTSAYFWQFTDSATVPGISKPVDNNRVLVARDAVNGLLIQ